MGDQFRRGVKAGIAAPSWPEIGQHRCRKGTIVTKKAGYRGNR